VRRAGECGGAGLVGGVGAWRANSGRRSVARLAREKAVAREKAWEIEWGFVKSRSVSALIVKRPWIDQILDGSTRVEYRTWRTRIRRTVGLIASDSPGLVLGRVDIVDCRENGERWEWLLRNPVRFRKPRRMVQKSGCVTWAKMAQPV
jgi:hypothetical protein